MQHAGAGLYTATKLAVLGLADVLRAELPGRITVSLLCPGLVDTELHLSKRHGPLDQDSAAALSFSGAVMAQGMPASEIGRAAVEGVLRGDFFIVTHASALKAATTRFEEIAAAFAAQAPWSPEAERFHVKAVIARLRRTRADEAAANRELKAPP